MVERTISSPNWSKRPNGVKDVWGVILHHTATGGNSAEAVARYFQNRSAEVAAHVVIGEDGLVIHCVDIKNAAWQAGRCRRYDWDRDGKLEDWEAYVNTHSIGIELCNRGDGKDDFPDAQIKAAALLVRRWDKVCPNLKLRDITDHQTVNLNGKIDMRPNFPAPKFFWWVINGTKSRMPSNPYDHLPGWAQRQVREIRQD